MIKQTLIGLLCIASLNLGQITFAQKKSVVTKKQPSRQFNYLLIATNKTSTAQKEMAEAAEAGYRFEDVMGGETSFGGSEVVVIMSKELGNQDGRVFRYKLLATSKTSTMQKELQEAGDSGFEFKGQTIFKTAFGGKEVVVILEQDSEKKLILYKYKLLATKKTSTMQKELREAGDDGFEFVGLTVAPSRFGGNEIISILRRKVAP